jgi:23S rRNA (cytosine1962-C5)-methyltransferase
MATNYHRQVVSTAHVALRGARRWTERFHPWIYRSDLIQTPSGGPGPVGVVDERGRFIGSALWSPTSAIALRMLTRDEVAIDAAFWHDRFARALAYRTALAPDADAYRVVHAEADGMPSLIVDRYGEHLVVQLLSAGLEACRAEILQALIDLVQPTGILARNEASVREHEQLPRIIELLHGTVPEQLEVRESRVRYEAAPWTGQKTGAFLDQRENRVRAGELARGNALDVFAYHGSFALHLATAATDVLAVDSSAEALTRAAENFRRNGFTHIRTLEANAFDLLRARESAGHEWDIIVLDPPAFAKRRDAVARALGGYKEINLRALRLLAPGGHLLTFSCSYHVDVTSFTEMLEEAAADAGRRVRWIEYRGQSADHPRIVQIPETSYLKGAVLQAVD